MIADTYVWFHGPCDRAGCIRVTKHRHLSTDPARADIAHRPRLASLRSATQAHGGLFTDTMSVADLIARLNQCPPDARVALDEGELNVIKDEKIATVINAYEPAGENFDAGNTILTVSR